MIQINEMTLAVLVAFYLFLAVRSDLVSRPLLFWVGAAAVAVVILGEFFCLGRSTQKTMVVFNIIGVLVAFVAGIGACCKMQLPISIQSTSTDSSATEE